MASHPSVLERLTVRRTVAITLVLALLVSAVPLLTGPFDYALGQLIGSFVMIFVVLLGLKRIVQWMRSPDADE